MPLPPQCVHWFLKGGARAQIDKKKASKASFLQDVWPVKARSRRLGLVNMAEGEEVAKAGITLKKKKRMLSGKET